MKIGVWGVGSIGTALACRLATMPFVSELVLVNRDQEKARARAIDIGHGLAFARSCWRVTAISEERAATVLDDVAVLVLTQGKPVRPKGSRAELYADNAGVFRTSVIERLRGFRGVVLVVTNPVDLLARLIHVETDLPAQRVIGLGTVVETARLRLALASNVSVSHAPQDLWAAVVGTHDKHCVVVPQELVAHGLVASDAELEAALEETIRGADRVKETGGTGTDEKPNVGTLHPVIEGAVAVVGAIASNGRRTHTVSVLDRKDPDRLFYSVPCTLGREGVIRQHRDALVPLEAALEKSKQAMRDVLTSTTAAP